jgi:FtsH-binding integral membrane protein
MEIVAQILQSEPLQKDAWLWFSAGLGISFLINIGLIVLFFGWWAYTATESDEVDLGFLGLLLLLVTILHLVGFSFVVAASTKGLDVKLLVAFVDVFVLIGSRLLAPDFLNYLADLPVEGAQTHNRPKPTQTRTGS